MSRKSTITIAAAVAAILTVGAASCGTDTETTARSEPTATQTVKDVDGDGLPDAKDPFPNDPDAPGKDRDGDGTFDPVDHAPDDPFVQTAPEYVAAATDFAVTPVVTSKQCFGSAGCLLTVEPQVEVANPAVPTSGTVTLRVSIGGDESGEIIDEIEVLLSTSTVSFQPVRMSTPNGEVAPVYTVTAIEYRK